MSKREKPFHLDISFGEALQRYAQTDPHQIAGAAKPKVASKAKNTPKKKQKKKDSSFSH